MDSVPDPRPPLDAARLPARVEVLDAAPSTNAVVAERARAGAAAGLVVVAEHQTHGRGRLDRSWETPARAGLTFSLLLRPELSPERWPWLPLWTGYAVHAALADRLPGLGLKWPNDVLVEDRKLAGILVERVETATGPVAVVGIGLNVSLTREELPVDTGTSIALETGEPDPDRTGILAGLLASLEASAPLLDDAAALRSAYTGACSTLGRRVRVEVPAGAPLVGTAEGIDDDGRLLVEAAGGVVAVGAGDVVHVR